jgi:cytidine deaminase
MLRALLSLGVGNKSYLCKENLQKLRYTEVSGVVENMVRRRGVSMKEALIAAAKQGRQTAYTPYSGFKVGAAVQAKDGRIFSGGNIENASYGLCNCAERTALFSAIAAGVKPREFVGMAVVAAGDQPVAPCGACRQVMYELLGEKVPVWLANLEGAVQETDMPQLLPAAFRLSDHPRE